MMFQANGKTFPLKLFKVVEDGLIIHWTDKGTAIVVEEFTYEGSVLEMYPGFVQVRSFHNLRRLLRDYGFGYKILRRHNDPFGLKIRFSHPRFTASTPIEALDAIQKSKKYQPIARSLSSKSKRKAETGTSSHNVSMRETYSDDRFVCIKIKNSTVILDTSTESTSDPRGASTRRHFSLLPNVSQKRRSSNSGRTGNRRQRTGFVSEKADLIQQKSGNMSGLASDKTTYDNEDIWALLQLVAKNELSEPEQFEVLLKHCDRLGLTANTWEEVYAILQRLGSRDSFPLYDSKTCRELALNEM